MNFKRVGRTIESNKTTKIKNKNKKHFQKYELRKFPDICLNQNSYNYFINKDYRISKCLF